MNKGSTEPVSVIYVGGYGRSGSSLLDSLLAREASALSAGEMCNLFGWASEGRPCGCGSNLDRCPVWGPVIESVRRKTGLSLRELDRSSQACERRGAAPGLWTEIWSAVFAQLGADGTMLVVDSSKSAGGRRRAELLNGLVDARVVVFVHLVRRLPAVVNSRRRGNNLALERGVQVRSWRGPAMLRATLAWILSNRQAAREAQRFNSVMVSYETLTLSPALGVGRILAEGGVQPGNPSTAPDGMNNHSIAGNRLLRSSWDGNIKPDTAWQSELPMPWRWVLGWFEEVVYLTRLAPRPGSDT